MLTKTTKLLFTLLAILPTTDINAQEDIGATPSPITVAAPTGKAIYIPNDLKDNDFSNPNSKWSFDRCAYTDDVILFWEKPFGNDLANAPKLDGHNMSINLPNLMGRIQQFYDYFRNELKFVLPGSKSEKYRMMVMLNYSLEGTAYGGDYDGEIGALWIAPNRVQDKKLNCIAHELGHSFQSQVMADGAGEAWGGGGIFEMTSQWMLWQVNPEWTTDENYHWQAFLKSHQKAFMDGENIYRSPYVLESWSMRHGLTVMADLFRAGKRGENPASTYMRLYNVSVDQMNREMTDCYSRLITFDFPRVKESHRKFAGEMVTRDRTEAPGLWGYHVVPLKEKGEWNAEIFAASKTGGKPSPTLSTKGKKDIRFEGQNTDENAAYYTQLVTVDANANATYHGILTGHKQTFQIPAKAENAYLVVVGCPAKEYQPATGGRRGRNTPEPLFPYNIK